MVNHKITSIMPNLNTARLILTPQDSEFILKDIKPFISQLSSEKFLADSLECDNDYLCFETGEDFLHQITFLGCSPTLYATDDAEQNKTFISIKQHNEIQFANSSAIPPARCPHCQKTDKNWPQYLQNWQQSAQTNETCPHCHKVFQFSEMKWKKNGGYGKLLIQIHGVQEQLAVPNQSFLDHLKTLTDTGWEYFFAE